ncbi:MAG: hypothetical protein R3C49_04935 [Planctomycetaceae bacterium]
MCWLLPEPALLWVLKLTSPLMVGSTVSSSGMVMSRLKPLLMPPLALRLKSVPMSTLEPLPVAVVPELEVPVPVDPVGKAEAEVPPVPGILRTVPPPVPDVLLPLVGVAGLATSVPCD